MRKSVRNSPASPQGDGEEVFQTPSRDSSAAPGEDHGEVGGHDLKELQPMESPPWSRFILKDCSPWDGPHGEEGERPAKEGAAERSCYGQHKTPHSPFLCASWGKRRGRGVEDER